MIDWKNLCNVFKCLLCVLFVTVVAGCAAQEPSLSSQFPKKPGDTTERKAGRAMIYYEQAEKDADINDSVIVIPPGEVKKKTD